MKDISVIGIDLAKRVFQLCAIDGCGEVVWQKRLKRVEFARFMLEKAPRCLIGLEACGGAHYWGRFLTDCGFEVKMMSPQAVKPYIGGGHKSDPRDARGIAEAATRAAVRPVRVKTQKAQACQAVVRVRERQVRYRTAVANQFRALLHEFGFAAPKGTKQLLAYYLKLVSSDEFEGLPQDVVEMFYSLHEEVLVANQLVATSAARLERLALHDETCQLAMTVPSIGPVNGASLSAVLEAPGDFRNGRAFAAWLGLVPRQHASGEKNAMKRITKHGQKQLRRTLVLAAHVLLITAARDIRKGRDVDRLHQWALALAGRRHRNVAATAIAARLARIVWAVVNQQTPYLARQAL